MEAQHELFLIISVTTILAIGPGGLSLLYESGHALLAVIGGKGGVEEPFLKSQPLLQWQFLIFFYVLSIRHLKYKRSCNKTWLFLFYVWSSFQKI